MPISSSLLRFVSGGEDCTWLFSGLPPGAEHTCTSTKVLGFSVHRVVLTVCKTLAWIVSVLAITLESRLYC